MSLELPKLTIQKKILETNDSVTLVFNIPELLKNQFIYQPGQYITLNLNINGQTVTRCYSFSSVCDSNESPRITIKRVENGIASNYILDQVKEGDTITVGPPAGHFFNKNLADEKPWHYILFAAGSGITPLYSILKYLLKSSKEHKVDLIYSNRFLDNIIFKEELEQLQTAHSEQLRIHHVISKPDATFTGFKGRLTSTILRLISSMHIEKVSLPKQVYMCGPQTYMQTIQEFFAGFLAPDQIHFESFDLHPVHHKAEENEKKLSDTDAVCIGSAYKEKIIGKSHIVATIDDDEVSVEYNSDDSILEALLNAGENPPFSCMSGSCLACRAKVVEGRVTQVEPGVLSDDDIDSGYTLSCQCHPLTANVKLNFDI